MKSAVRGSGGSVVDGGKLRASAQAGHAQLLRWLLRDAYPIWSTRGIDGVRGGFHERLSLTGEPVAAHRRARVQPRQIVAFSQAPSLGWSGNARGAVLHGLSYFLTRYRRPDGLFRTLITPDGASLDDRALLYDQAFALLAFATAGPIAGDAFDLAVEAEKLRLALFKRFKRSGRGFESGWPPSLPLLSNPHMHLFESAIAWSHAGGGLQWQTLADDLGELALTHMIDATTGTLRESFASSWAPAPGLAGRIVEPGHQYEWAWLLLRWGGERHVEARRAAFRLIDLSEKHGVHRGVAINALLDNTSIHDEEARLWPQTERLRAASLAARLSDDARYWAMTGDAAAGLLRYFATPVAGLWFDRLLPSGGFVNEAVTAGNLYHIVGAIYELDALISQVS